MQSMQRQVGKFMKRSADDSQVAVLMNDFSEADKLLGRIADSTKSWRDAWTSILSYQCRMVTEFNGLYAPIVGSSEPTSDRDAVATPEATLARTARLRDDYEDLQTELMQELNAMEGRMIRPALQAKEFLLPMKKTIKQREDRKLDYERYQSRVDSYNKKSKRSDRDNASLAKAELDLSKATEDYNAADETLRQRLPPLISTVFSLLPRLLATQIEIQNAMLATSYTVLYNYANDHHFASPAPEMDQIIHTAESTLHPVQSEIESFAILAHGKFRLQNHNSQDNQSCSGGGGGGGILANGLGKFSRRGGGGHLPPPSDDPQEQEPRYQKRDNNRSPQPNYESKPRLGSADTTTTSSTAADDSPYPSSYAQDPPSTITTPASSTGPAPGVMSFSPAGPKIDYFTRDRQAGAGDYSAAVAAVAAKKKPPPPPPRTPSTNALFVTALFDFSGQGPGDLAFREGDRIRVLEKTESTDDWWEGELRGVKGSFPANYVE